MTTLNLPLWLFAALLFLATIALVFGIYSVGQRRRATRRLETFDGRQGAGGKSDRVTSNEAWIKSIARAAGPLAKLSVPNDDWQGSDLRRRFMRAGIRSESAPVIFFALKTVLAIGLPVLCWLIVRALGSKLQGVQLVYVLIALLVVGYYLPNWILKRMTENRQREIFENFPDALDLLTICIEAGSSLDSGLDRVAREIRLKSDVLSDELSLVVLEMRAGAGKERALRNLSLRTGVDDVDTLVATLVQSEKFGTSVGQALRVHSDMLRTKRQQRAEEAAAKVAIKLLLPLIVCIFPAILVVVGGPAMLRIIRELPKMFS